MECMCTRHRQTAGIVGISSMGLQGMEVQHQFARGFWEHEVPPPTSLSLGCKRLHSLAPNLTAASVVGGGGGIGRPRNSSNFKIFIKPRVSGDSSSDSQKSPQSPPQVETPAAAQFPTSGPGTRWNPTPEQIGILETLYGGGMRTPNAQQIEHITAHLAMYGRIEGKNVFYWFQNHKARERQKQKRNNRTPDAGATNCDLSLSTTTTGESGAHVSESGTQVCKRKRMEEEELREDRTLTLFPLHPEPKF